MKTKSASTKAVRTAIAAMEAHNARIRAEHAKLVDAILTLRPGWDRAALAAVARTWGTEIGKTPGLGDILRIVQEEDALATAFAKKV